MACFLLLLSFPPPLPLSEQGEQKNDTSLTRWREGVIIKRNAMKNFSGSGSEWPSKRKCKTCRSFKGQHD